jgi:hypothetical protein
MRSLKRTILCHWGWVVTNGIRAIAQPMMGGACTSQWGTLAGTLGPKKGWLWRPTSPVNEDVLICINAPFMTQRVLKPWWSWTYQNSAVKRASSRAILGWVTSLEVWYEEPKADNIMSLGLSRYKWYQSHCPACDGGSVHKPMRDASGDAGSKEGVIVTSHIACEWRCAYMYKCTLYDTTRFKAVMVMNLSELRS